MVYCGSNDDELNGGCAAALFIQYPLVPTREHLCSQTRTRTPDGSLAGSDKDIKDDDMTASTTVSTPSLSGNFWDSPCTAVTNGLASCSCYSIPPPTDSKVDLDTVIYDEAQSKIDQGKVDHARAMKAIKDELLMHFHDIKENQATEAEETVVTEDTEEASIQSEKSEPECVDPEHNETAKGLGTAATKKTPFSPFKNSRFRRHAAERKTPPTEPEEKSEESLGEKDDLQMVYSSPTSLRYRFKDGTDDRATPDDTKKKIKKKKKNIFSMIQRSKKANSKPKRRKNMQAEDSPIDDGTRVRAVAIAW